MRISWQNLDEGKRGHDRSWGWRHGRAWLDLGSQANLSVEWAGLGAARGLTFEISLGGDHHDVMLSVSVPWLFSIYLGALLLPYRSKPPWMRSTSHGLQTGVSWHEESIRFEVLRDWTAGTTHDRRTPRWKRILINREVTISLSYFFLGMGTYENQVLETIETVIPMPEGSYSCTIEVQREVRGYRRWPFKRVSLCCWMTVPGGVPVPGSGESEWSCGEDAIISSRSSSDDIGKAIGSFVERVTTRRLRYGSLNWRPTQKHSMTASAQTSQDYDRV